jgi:hypothetical protein
MSWATSWATQEQPSSSGACAHPLLGILARFLNANFRRVKQAGRTVAKSGHGLFSYDMTHKSQFCFISNIVGLTEKVYRT